MRSTVPAITTLAGLLALGACSEFKGPRAPADQLYYPVGAAVHPDGEFLYVANANFDSRYRTDIGGTLTVLDANTLEILPDKTIEIGSFAGGLVLNTGRPGDDVPDRLYVAVRGDDSLVVLSVSDDGSEVRCPNAAPGEAHALACRVPVAEDPFALTMVDLGRDGEREAREDLDLVATVGINGSVSYVTLGTDDAGGFDIDDAHVEDAVIVNGASTVRYLDATREVWVAGRFSRRIRGLTHVFDPGAATRAEVARVLVSNQTFVPSTLESAEVRDIVFSLDGSRAYVSLNRPSAILAIDMTPDDDGDARGTVLERFDIDGSPQQMVVVEEAGREVLYAALSADEALVAIDASTGVPLEYVQLDGLAYALAHDAERRRLYVTLFDEHAIAMIDIDPSSVNTFRNVVRRTR